MASYPNDQGQVAGAIPVYQVGGGPSGGGSTTPLGYQQLTGMVAAVALTVPLGATVALVVVEGPDVRWRDDGVNPTAAVGMRLFTGVEPRLFSGAGELAALRFIQTATGSILNVSYYK